MKKTLLKRLLESVVRFKVKESETYSSKHKLGWPNAYDAMTCLFAFEFVGEKKEEKEEEEKRMGKAGKSDRQKDRKNPEKKWKDMKF